MNENETIIPVSRDEYTALLEYKLKTDIALHIWETQDKYRAMDALGAMFDIGVSNE